MRKTAGAGIADKIGGSLVAVADDDLLRRLNADRAANGRPPVSAEEMYGLLAELRRHGLVSGGWKLS
ncbi:MAG: hypothetical protein KAY22_18545 [Rhizorhabdus sp.]|uniref:hypothetical protein n=1 Tax=Rhizorhabdus sp. TaxID=1968843 RepID=UPI001B43E0A3|nr:hypothetical protein [Rhizorhabdus sp.]MBP8234299.1 hypothetical protein [Rhizorhabdus sp.]